MLRYRSAAFLVRFYAPQVMLGYHTVEEVEDVVSTGMAVAEPLTGAALLQQALPGPETDEDPETPAEVSEHEAAGEAFNTPDTHPSRQVAAEIVSKLKRAGTVAKVDELMATNAANIDAFPEDVQREVADAEAAARARLGGEQG